MNKYHKANHIVLILVIAAVIGLLGGVSYFVYTNLTKSNTSNTISKEDNQPEPSISNATEVEATFKTKKIEDTLNAGLTFFVPEDWVVDNKVEKAYDLFKPDIEKTFEDIKITSPDGNTAVNYNLQINCGQNGGAFLDQFEIKYIYNQEVPNFKNAIYSEVILFADNSYLWQAGLRSKDSVVPNLKNGDTYELYDLEFTKYFGLGRKNFCPESQVVLRVDGIEVKNKTPNIYFNDYLPRLTQTDIEQMFKSEDFIKAKNILLSTKYN